MNIRRSIFAGTALLALPVEAQEHRFEADPVVTVRENLPAKRMAQRNKDTNGEVCSSLSAASPPTTAAATARTATA
jgi:hypothetical protein